jgi:1,4-alpha-glucan branching enzyme
MDENVYTRLRRRKATVPWRENGPAGHKRRLLETATPPIPPSDGKQAAMFRHLGAHLDRVDGIDGARFAVWAPNAREVCVLTDQNAWRHGAHWLYGSNSGVWSGFVPGMGHGSLYKFGIRTPSGELLQKSDPVAFACEVRPKTASVVYDLGDFEWHDQDWRRHRESVNWFEQPISIYEVHLGSWRRPSEPDRLFFNYRELAHMLVEYCQQMGYTHLQLLPVTEHPFDGSWGYQTTGYFAPTSRHGSPHDFMYFMDYCHTHGIGVLVDWVPGHFPMDAHSLGRFDGTCCYEHADPRLGQHPDWGTYIFNYGRFEVRDFLLSSARFWFDVYHVDGIRVDAVASMLYLDYSRRDGEWIPNVFGGRENLEAIQFLKDMNTILHGEFPGVLTIAEESTAWGGVSRPVYCGGLGFSMKWDMGWMNDTLRYAQHDPIHRQHHHGELSFRMVYAFTENFVLPLSHDEVVHGKRALLSQMPGDHWQKFANLRMLFGYQYTMPGKKLLFMGGEFGQWLEWNSNTELDWALFGHERHDGLRRFVGDLNRVYREQPALHQVDFDSPGFAWIQCDDWQQSVYAYSRFAKDPNDFVVVVLNFTPVPRHNYRIGVPQPGEYTEILNSDAKIYCGSNIGNQGRVVTSTVAAHGQPQSLKLSLPPLGMVVLKPHV